MSDTNHQAEMKAELERLRGEVATLKLAEQGRVASIKDGGTRGFSPSFLEANFGIHEQASGVYRHKERRSGITKTLWLLLLVGGMAAMLAIGATMAPAGTQVVEEPSSDVAAFNGVDETQAEAVGRVVGAKTRSGRSRSSESSEDSSDEGYNPVTPAKPNPTRAPVPSPTRAPVPSPTRAPIPSPTPVPGGNTCSPPSCVTRAELQRHSSANNCWLALHGRVYDLTSYAANEHPGGPRVITNHCGTDGTSAYGVFHNSGLLSILSNNSFKGSLETRSTRGRNSFSGSGDSSEESEEPMDSSDETNYNPAPTPDPSPDPTPSPVSAEVQPSPTPDPSPDPTPRPVSSEVQPSPTPRPASNSQPAPTRNPTPDPTPGPTPDPTPGPTPDPTPGPTPDPTPGPTPGVQTISSAQLQNHNSANDCWVLIDGDVYDLTVYADKHPGGASVITNLCGTDGSAMYAIFHDTVLLGLLLTKGELQGPFGN